MIRCLTIAALLASAVSAQAAEILKKVPPQLASDKAYAVLELRDVSPLGSGDVPGNIVLARYDPVGLDVRGGARSPGSAVPAGESIRVAVAKSPLVKAKDSRLYLLALEPDTWVVEGSAGTAFSLGSHSFVLEAGSVTDLGVLAPLPDWSEGDSAGKEFKRVLVGAMFFGALAKKGNPTPYKAEWHERGAGDIVVPPELAARIRPAQFFKGAKFGNYLGGLVNRIDGRAGRPGAPGGGESQSGTSEQPTDAVHPARQDTEKSAPAVETIPLENSNAARAQ